jgi:ketosteroid isomerase-like protein
VDTTIRGLTQDFCTAFNTGNYDQAAAIYAVDTVVMTPDREPAHGTRNAERLFRQLADSGYEHIRQETLRVDCSGDMALEIGRYTLTIRTPKQNALLEHGSFMRVWRRLGSWFVAAESWASHTPKPIPALGASDDARVA